MAMQDGVIPPDTANLATIHDEVASLTRLVADLRDLSPGDVGQFEIEREPVDVAGILDSVGEAFATASAGRGVTLTVDLAPELPCFERFFHADQSRNRQIGGTGLGFGLVQQIVRLPGGDVVVASDGPGLEATFTINLLSIVTSDVGQLVGPVP